jgi:serine/threonine protein kinase
VTLEIPAALSAALAGRYELRRVLGQGGMATVYLAADVKHGREVALKVLLPGLAAFLGVERFLREIQIAARLTHPHILALYDSGEAEGFLFYVMPYIEGASLRQQLVARSPFTPAEALAIASPVADALGYAHRMGIFHRDIKPENILFSQGHPIVADFGIAKAISTAGGANLTRTGFPVGTPGYMSPEQAAGLTDLDARTDVYSLAVVIYEMLVGELPGRWPTEDAVRQGRFLEAPPPHRATFAHLGARIEGGLVRGLSTRRDQRTPTPLALIDDLTGVAQPTPRRRFSGGEVEAIVKRVSELEALAAEVGITPDLVRQAAQEVGRRGTPPTAPLRIKPNPWIAGPTRIFTERVVEVEVPESEFPIMVEYIRRVLRNVGQVNQLGRSFSWVWVTAPFKSRHDLEVAVSVRGGRTRITIQENLAPVIGGVFGWIGGGMGGGGMGPIMGILGGALHLGPAAVVPIWLGATYITARSVYRNITTKRVRELENLADRLAEYTQ